MDLIQIHQQKENDIVFDVEVEGLLPNSVDVRLNIYVNADTAMLFKATHKEKNTYGVTVPPLTYFEKGLYNYDIEVVIEGYFFKAAKGRIDLITPSDISEVKTKDIKSSVKLDKKSTTEDLVKHIKESKPTSTHKNVPLDTSEDKKVTEKHDQEQNKPNQETLTNINEKSSVKINEEQKGSSTSNEKNKTQQNIDEISALFDKQKLENAPLPKINENKSIIEDKRKRNDEVIKKLISEKQDKKEINQNINELNNKVSESIYSPSKSIIEDKRKRNDEVIKKLISENQDKKITSENTSNKVKLKIKK